jgi:uncharacterized protein
MKKRIIGIDVARALAVIGMIIVNFKVVFGENGDSWLKSFAHLFDGKAAATFVVLAGIGLALMTNSAVKDQNEEKLQVGRKRIIKRAIFLFLIGLSYIWIWPADILHFYGIYMLVTLFFINKSPKLILIAAISLIVIYPLLLIGFHYEIGWNFLTLEYTDFWTFNGFFRNLFYNGFHPVIPWTAFMLFGLWYGKQDLHDDKFLKKSLRVGLGVFISMQILSIGLIQFISKGNPRAMEALIPLLGTNPMPPMPIYMVNGISISIVIISACIILAKRYENSKIIAALNKTGQLALTFYVAHVILGMGIVEEFSSLKFGEFSIEFSVIYALIFSLLCIIFAEIWLRYKKSGPLEWVMRKLTD